MVLVPGVLRYETRSVYRCYVVFSDDCAVFLLRIRWPGLRYDDLYDDLYDLDIKEALNRLPQQEVDFRNQRLKRAMDYSAKHMYMPKDLQVGVHIFSSHLWNSSRFLSPP